VRCTRPKKRMAGETASDEPISYAESNFKFNIYFAIYYKIITEQN
jgi:hypothetical protein